MKEDSASHIHLQLIALFVSEAAIAEKTDLQR
jgi:hypothetical protein